MGQTRVETVQAIDKMNLGACGLPDNRRYLQQPQGLEPEIIGRKIINPGVNEEEMLHFLTATKAGGGRCLAHPPHAEGGTRTHTAFRP